MREIHTDRLAIVPITSNHCTDKYVSWLNDPDVYKYLETRGNYTIEQLKEYLSTIVDSKILMWAIHIRDSNKHIGNIKIDPVNKKHGLGEYGILMGEKAEWGKGYAKEASEAVIEYCFGKELNLRKITLGVIKENEPACYLYNKLGFIEEGIYTKHLNYDGHYYDIIRMAIFNHSFAYSE